MNIWKALKKLFVKVKPSKDISYYEKVHDKGVLQYNSYQFFHIVYIFYGTYVYAEFTHSTKKVLKTF